MESPLRDLSAFAGLRGLPFVIGLVEWVKRLFPACPARAIPAIAVAIGLALNVAVALLSGGDLAMGVFGGLEAGLAAVGLYSGVSAVARKGGD